MKSVHIVGAGVAGLASSIRLALKGYQVTVFEANDYPGGKLSAFELKWYRFDAGPSLFTMPDYITQLFDMAGLEAETYFQYKKKDVACNYFWSDHTQFTAYSDRHLFIKEVEKVFGEPAEKVEKYLKKAQKKYTLTHSLFLEQSLHRFKTYFTLSTLKAIANLRVLELPKSLHQVNQENFKAAQLVQLFDRYATYNGSDPFQTSGIMTLIQHLEGHYGTFIPTKGMVSITQALFDLAKKLGVHFHFNTRVH